MQKLMNPFQFVDENFEWHWYDLYSSKTAIIGDKNQSNKMQLLEKISDTLYQIDHKSLFWIGDVRPGESETSDDFNMIEFESQPAERHVRNGPFEETRMSFVQLYFEALCIKRGVTRSELIPLASYRKHQEGPLVGYLRAINSLQDSEEKEWLLKELKKLETITWNYKRGYVYETKDVESPVDLLIEYIKGMWSYWALTSSLAEPQQMLLVIDIPKKLTEMDTSVEIKEIIRKLLGSIVQLSEIITVSVIISTETMFPVPELNIRHQLYLPYSSNDFSWHQVENQPFFNSDVIEAWSNHNSSCGLWIDFATGEKTTLHDTNKILFKNRVEIESAIE
ncbi:hypothetical protein [Bacillus sp. NTK034]|uniref:hypothetical protein n=1 Tax=Bacillus sp. NTK034 TaxID=2802176 RepID=UPI001A8F2A7B|nr:hypothetical protein [Bacillus sp. NTK034]MBN8202549.1 hypothetical protein [Bacillus sp. NTK034]